MSTPCFNEDVNETKKHYLPKISKISLKTNWATPASAFLKDPRSPTEKVPRTPLEEKSNSSKDICFTLGLQG